MSKVVNFERFLRDRSFNNDVVPFIYGINPAFQNYKYESEAVFYFSYKMHVFIFMRYIESGFRTEYPTLNEAMKKVKSNPRISEGEWVVEKTIELSHDKARPFYQLIYQKKKEEDFIQRLKKEIKKVNS